MEYELGKRLDSIDQKLNWLIETKIAEGEKKRRAEPEEEPEPKAEQKRGPGRPRKDETEKRIQKPITNPEEEEDGIQRIREL